MAEVKYLDKTGLTSVWSKVKGIVTPKADKVSGATAGHLAGLNSGGNLVDSGLAADNIAQKDGSYSGMTVGAAEDLVSAESVASEFTSRITGGSTAVGKGGTALVDKIKGRTLVWNQLENGTWTSAFNLVKDGNTYTLSANAERDTLTMSYNNPFIARHKYFVKAHLKLNREASLSGSFYPGYFATPTQWVSYGITGERLRAGFDLKEIITLATDKTTLYLGAYHVGTTDKFATTDTLVISNPQVYDLTLMFGEGSEPATPEEFEALYPGPRYDNNAGTLVSNAATAIETVGWNLADVDSVFSNISGWLNLGGGEWYIPVGKANAGTVVWKNELGYTGQIQIHYEKKAVGGTNGERLSIFYTDGTRQDCNPSTVLNTYETGDYLSLSEKIVDYVYTNFGSGSADSYIKNICLSLSDPSRNGTYEPHWRSRLDLNIPTLTGKLNGTGNSVVIFPDGLRSAGTVYDEIVGNKAIKRIGAVDMGTMVWSTTTQDRIYSASLASVIKKTGGDTDYANCVCTRYLVGTAAGAYAHTFDKLISVNAAGNVTVYDSAFAGMSASAVTLALAGVPLYYELATPEEYILDEAIPTAMRNDPYGTERRLPEDTAAIVTAPFRADITYSTNIKEAVQSLPQNFINVNSMQDFLAALGTLMGGTWTMRPADGKFDFTFTPNPSND